MQIQREIRRGALITFAAKYSGIIVGLIINSILARLLSLADFGMVAIFNVFIAFFSILSDIGIGVAVIQNQDLTKLDTSNIFKISIIISFTLATLFYFISYGIAEFYESHELIQPLQLLSIAILFSSASVVPKSIIFKHRQFKTSGIIEVVVSFAFGLLAVLFATKGMTYYAIVWRSVLSSIALFGLYWYVSKIQILSGLSIQVIRKIGRYSANQFAFNFINYFSRNLDNILIGKYMDGISLGLYSQAYQLMMYPVANLTHVITPVLHPVLAKYQDNKKIIFREYLKVIDILALLGIPISIFVFFASQEIIMLLLGDRWTEVAPILQILSASIWIQMIMSSSGSIFQATGRTDLLLVSGVISAILMVFSIILGIFYFNSLIILSYCLVGAFALNFLICFYILIVSVLKEPQYPLYQIIFKNIPLFITSVVMLNISNYVTRDIDMSFLHTLLVKGVLMSFIFAIHNKKRVTKLLKTLSSR